MSQGEIVEATTDGLVHPTCGGPHCVAASPAPTHEPSTCPLHTGKVLRQVTVAEQRSTLLQAMIVGPARALALLKRVPEVLKQRGWPTCLPAVHLVALAVGAYKLGAQGQRFQVPPELVAHPAWFKLAAASPNGRPSAREIVEGFSLERLLEPA